MKRTASYPTARLLAGLTTAMIGFGPALDARAGLSDYFWQGDDATSPNDFGTAENWDFGQVPNSDFNAVFPASASTFTVDLNGVRAINGVRFSGGANGYTLNGGRLDLDSVLGLVVFAADVTHTINSGIGLDSGPGSDHIWNVGESATLVLNGSIVDGTNAPTRFVSNGIGTIELNGTNTYTADTVLNDGVLRVSTPDALGAASSVVRFGGGTLSVASSGGPVEFPATRSFVADTADAVIDAAGPHAHRVSGTVSGGFGLTKTGAAQLILDGANTHAGGTTVTEGALTLGHSAAAGTGTITVDGRATIQEAFEQDAGVFNLTGHASVTGGELLLTPALNAQAGSANSTTIAGTPVERFEATYDFRIGGGSFDGGDGLSFNLLNANTHGDTTFLSENGPLNDALTVTFDTYNNVGEGENVAILWHNGTQLASRIPSFDLENDLLNSATVTFDGNNLTLTVTPNGGAPETFFDNVAVPGFTPTIARIGFGARTGAEFNAHRIDNVSFTADVGITPTLDYADGVTIDNPVSLASDVHLAVAAGSATQAGSITEQGTFLSTGLSVTKTGAGTLNLTGSNAYTGPTSVAGGRLVVTREPANSPSTDAIPDGSAVTVADGATLQIGTGGGATGVSESIGSLAGAGNVEFGALNTSLALGYENLDTTFSGVLSGPATPTNHFTKTGTGTLTLSGNNTYEGNLRINQGTLAISSDANLGGPNARVLFNTNAGGTLQVTASHATDRNILGQDKTFSVDPGVTYTVNGEIQEFGPSGLLQVGTGTLNLTNNNTYTGNTVVDGGTLLVNNTTGSATGSGDVFIDGTATLGGNGSIAGNVTVDSDATLSPGMSPGRLDVGGVGFNPGSAFDV